MKRRAAPQPPPQAAAFSSLAGANREQEHINYLLGLDNDNENEEISTKSPLMQTFATAAHKRKSVLLHKIHNTLEVLPMSHMSVTSCEVATDSMAFDKRDAAFDPISLLSEILSLPTTMKEKREFKNKLLQAAKTKTVRETSTFETYYQRVKNRISDIYNELNSKVEWEFTSVKAIEGHFGTGVVSYFVFLRWLIVLNIVLFLVTVLSIVLPQAGFPVTFDPTKFHLPFHHTKDNSTAYLNFSNFREFVIRRSELETGDKLKKRDLQSIDKLKPHGLGSYDKLKTSDLGSLLNELVTEDFLDLTLRNSDDNLTRADLYERADFCSNIYLKMLNNVTRSSFLTYIQDFFQGTGWMENTLLFIGHYKPFDVQFGSVLYAIPLAFMVVLFSLVFLNLFMMMIYASKGLEEMMLKNVTEQYCCIVFSGWDFCIENEKTADRQHTNVLYEAKSSLSEGRRKAEISNWTTHYKTKVHIIRACVYVATVLMLIGAYYLLFYVTKEQIRAENVGPQEGLRPLIMKFLPSMTLTALNFTIPLILGYLIVFEEYRFQTEINVFLLRVVFVRLSSIIIIVWTFYGQITCQPQDMCSKGMGTCSSPICWETYVGQQMYRLVVMDFFVHIAVILFWETPRRMIEIKWEKSVMFLGYRIFDIPTQVLALVYSQTLCWLGMFYCPLLPAVSLIKLVIFFYVKKYSLLKNCVPHKVAYKASRSNAIFIVVLMLSFFITIAILGYSLTQIKPSPACGPFQHNSKNMVDSVYTDIEFKSPELATVFMFVFSAVCQMPLIIVLCLVLYYYVTKTSAHKQMVKMLKTQLTMEGKDKLFLLSRVTRIHRSTNRRTGSRS